ERAGANTDENDRIQPRRLRRVDERLAVAVGELFLGIVDLAAGAVVQNRTDDDRAGADDDRDLAERILVVPALLLGGLGLLHRGGPRRRRRRHRRRAGLAAEIRPVVRDLLDVGRRRRVLCGLRVVLLGALRLGDLLLASRARLLRELGRILRRLRREVL